MHGETWERLDTTVVFENRWCRAGFDRVRAPDGDEREYYWLDPPDGAEIVAVDDGDLLLLERYRPRWDETVFECPGGGVERGETPTEAAKRELREETGYVAGEAETLLTYKPSPWLTLDRSIVLATDLERVEERTDPLEFGTVHRVPVEEAFDLLRDDPVAGLLIEPLLIARFFDAI